MHGADSGRRQGQEEAQGWQEVGEWAAKLETRPGSGISRKRSTLEIKRETHACMIKL